MMYADRNGGLLFACASAIVSIQTGADDCLVKAKE